VARRRAALVAGALLLGALGLLAAGCGSSGTNASRPPAASTTAKTTTAATTTRGNAPPALRALQSCLKAHGVTLPARPFRFRAGARPPATTTPARPRPFGRFRNVSPKARQAFQACRSSLPNGGFRRPPGAFRGNGAGAFARYTRCLAQHGVHFGRGSAPTKSFRKAQAACSSLLRPPAPPATTTAKS
jgi:hypothetical protein